MKVNDIGIIGYWFATNYGGVASYYSLYKKIEELGYSPFFVENPYLETDREGLDTFPRKFLNGIGAKISDCYKMDELQSLNDLTETFILGSDQVLTSSSIKAFGALFLMGFADNKRKIAISSSCGGDNLNVDASLLKYAKNNLKDFTAISVREYSAVNIMRDKFGIYADHIIDPIFFTSKERYYELAKCIKTETINEPYLLAYVLDPTPEKKQAINKIANELGLKIKIALDGRKFTYNKNFDLMDMSNEILPELDFQEWLYYLSNSAYVFTDSFHGASMALIMNKPFIMYANYMRGYPRFLTLAKIFNVKSRLVENSAEITELLLKEQLDFDVINEIIKRKCQNAEKWLIDALKKEKTTTIPHYSIDSYKNKEYEKYDICPKIKCTGCAACANICPAKCIELKPDEEGFPYPVINKEKCIDCKLCEKICPALNRNIDNEKKPLNIYAGYSLDSDTRYMSTSGGAFTEFAKYVLKMSGVCYGAAYDEKHNVQHVRIDSENDLPIIRQSKYLQSNINDTFKSIQKDLEHGLYVMFCGTPCQCAGLKACLKKEYDRLIIVDFICHSICSPKAYQYYLKDIEKQNNASISRVWFKNKESTWKNFSLRIDFRNRENYYRRTVKNDAYFDSFLKYRVCSRPSCHNCQFKGTDRTSDITLADFWGLKWKNPSLGEDDMKDGVSLIMINSSKGKSIFDVFSKHQMYCEEHSLEDAVKGNGGYYNSQRPGLYRDFFFENLEMISYHELIDIIAKNEENLRKTRENNN